MSVLSAQSIRRLCSPPVYRLEERKYPDVGTYTKQVLLTDQPMISPFSERAVVNGRSYGLSSCSYDFRIGQDLTLTPGSTALVSTIERVCLPSNICASVLDKSSLARRFVTAFNTHFDPGFEGYPTIELANLGTETVVYKVGDPVCQFRFEWLDEPTDLPYSGKYQNQPAHPVAAVDEV